MVTVNMAVRVLRGVLMVTVISVLRLQMVVVVVVIMAVKRQRAGGFVAEQRPIFG